MFSSSSQHIFVERIVYVRNIFQEEAELHIINKAEGGWQGPGSRVRSVLPNRGNRECRLQDTSEVCILGVERGRG